jgi:RNA polymerase sigma-70 factor (ECF subfamily)
MLALAIGGSMVGSGDVADDVDDMTLFDRWRDGDAAAGHTLFERHFDSIYRFFETKFDAEADELVQSTFLACVRARDQFRKQSSFRTYLFTIARHELYRVLKTRRRDLERIDFDASSIAELVTTPNTKIARNRDQQRLLAALRKLSVEQQTLLELHYWEGLDANELAETFEVENATIRTRLHRARKALRDKIEGMEEPATFDSIEAMDEWAKRTVAKGA